MNTDYTYCQGNGSDKCSLCRRYLSTPTNVPLWWLTIDEIECLNFEEK